MRNLLLSCWSVLYKGLPKHTGYCYCLGGPPDGEGKPLLLKTPCTSDACPRDYELELTWISPPWGLTFMVPGVARQPYKGGKPPTVLQLWSLLTAAKLTWHNSPKSAAVLCRAWRWPLTLELDGACTGLSQAESQELRVGSGHQLPPLAKKLALARIICKGNISFCQLSLTGDINHT